MPSRPLRVLFVTPECTPWVKTGGLADVAGTLPVALQACGADVRVLMPAYRGIVARAGEQRQMAGWPALGRLPAADLVEAQLPQGVPAYLIDSPLLYDRANGPYQDAEGVDWSDNGRRFAQLGRIAAELGSTRSPLDWQPDLLHCNDWQAALAPAYLHFDRDAAARALVTIHNLAFQGIFPASIVAEIGLPPESVDINGVEYFGQASFLKAGLYYADAITTVSPTYAEEIQREPLGMGLHGLLAGRRDVLSGILNGIDTATWNPAADPLIARTYDIESLAAKADNKRALQSITGLVDGGPAPLLAMVSRLTEQKGVDLVAAVAAKLVELPAQLVVLGVGDAIYESALRALARAYPGMVSVTIGFDETLAHLIEAAADIFLMPSRFEPCGMNQMYSQRYGTVPVVHATGGLVDSVIDCSPRSLADHSATGFVFRQPTPHAFLTAIERAVGTYRNARTWRALQINGMKRDFGWDASARRYLEIYERVVAAAR